MKKHYLIIALILFFSPLRFEAFEGCFVEFGNSNQCYTGTLACFPSYNTNFLLYGDNIADLCTQFNECMQGYTESVAEAGVYLNKAIELAKKNKQLKAQIKALKRRK